MAGSRTDWLATLEVSPSASAEEIERQYRDLVRVWHPDRFANDPRLRLKADEKLKEINAAYGQLKEAARRDDGRRRSGTESGSSGATQAKPSANSSEHARGGNAASQANHPILICCPHCGVRCTVPVALHAEHKIRCPNVGCRRVFLLRAGLGFQWTAEPPEAEARDTRTEGRESRGRAANGLAMWIVFLGIVGTIWVLIDLRRYPAESTQPGRRVATSDPFDPDVRPETGQVWTKAPNQALKSVPADKYDFGDIPYAVPRTEETPPEVAKPKYVSTNPFDGDEQPSLNRKPAPVPPANPRFLTNGTQWGNARARGRGILRIQNGQALDAVGAIFQLNSTSPDLAVYVRRHESAELGAIAPGTYAIRFSSGIDWDDGTRRFTYAVAYSQFEQPTVYAETETSGRVSFKKVEVTLHSVPDGRARTLKISAAQFDLSGLVPLRHP